MAGLRIGGATNPQRAQGGQVINRNFLAPPVHPATGNDGFFCSRSQSFVQQQQVQARARRFWLLATKVRSRGGVVRRAGALSRSPVGRKRSQGPSN